MLSFDNSKSVVVLFLTFSGLMLLIWWQEEHLLNKHQK